jgi:catechol 2,3-dioxygenase
MLEPPKTTQSPPFRITRASHLVYTVRDLSRSRDFYTEVLGLVVSDEDRDTLYLRGVEERVHHSLVLKRTDGAPACIRAGPLTEDEEELEKAKFFFAGCGPNSSRCRIRLVPCTPRMSRARRWSCTLI